jgi:hypothetical protein
MSEGWALALGSFDGLPEGSTLLEGELDGMLEGWALALASFDGLPEGGTLVERELDGMLEGWTLALGSFDGLPEGWTLLEGELDGILEGSALFEGVLVVGRSVGVSVGGLVPVQPQASCLEKLPHASWHSLVMHKVSWLH